MAPLPAAMPMDWTWCLHLPQRFDSLLRIAADLIRAQWRPGEEEETGGPLLNLYLVVCGLVQILNDYLYGSPRSSESAHPGHGLAAGHEVAAFLNFGLKHKERRLHGVARALAARILDGEHSVGPDDRRSVARLRATRWPARLRSGQLRVPPCFRGADLYPKDCELLAERVAKAVGDSDRHVLVIGLTTSVWYLGPLLAAALERLGHRAVSLASLQTDRQPAAHQADVIRKLVERDGWALVVGDPNSDGVDSMNAIRTLKGLGLPESRITVGAHGRFGGSLLSRGDLGESGRIVLRHNECHIRSLLSDALVERWLNRAPVLERLHAAAAAVLNGNWLEPDRSQPNVQRLFEVELQCDGKRWREFILGTGVGLGFFGYHAWLAASCMADWTHETVGIHHGLLFLRWAPGQELSGPIESEDLEEIGTYVAARARRLALGSDQPEVRCLSELTLQVARSVGKSRDGGARDEQVRIIRMTAKAPFSRQSVVDGNMGPSEWARSAEKGLLKRHSLARSPEITDPVHDLAATVVGFRLDIDEERRLVDTYERLTGDTNDLAARLAVHKLRLGWSELMELPSVGFDLKTRGGRLAFARELVLRETVLTRTVNSYLAGLYLTNTGADMGGQVWALDMDGPMETDRLGFESASPAAVQAIHILLAHGQRVLVCTGSSLGELRERCRTFGLLGGVAEHGGVIWDEQRKEALTTIGEEARLSIARLREALLDETDVLVDPRYQYSLRLFRHTDEGRQAANTAEVRAVIARKGITGLDLVEDSRWTMVCPSGASTAGAFQRLSSTKWSPSSVGSLRVVGSSPGDIELMRKADGCYALASSSAEFRTRAAGLPVWYASRAYQAGTLQIVRRVLHGSSRSSCSVCRASPTPRLNPADTALVKALGLQDQGHRSRLAVFR